MRSTPRRRSFSEDFSGSLRRLGATMIKVNLLVFRSDNIEDFVLERVWATPIAENRARIENIPLTTNWVGLNDIVELQDDDVVDVVERVTFSCRGSYDAAGTKEEVLRRWASIRGHFISHDIQVEGTIRGLFRLAVPTSTKEQTLRAIVASCPEAVDLECTCARCGSFIGEHDRCPASQL